MYRNLEAEMVRLGITKKDMAKKLGMRYPTLTDKLRGKYPLHFEEALKIQYEFFPDLPLDYLFSQSNQKREKAL